MERRKVSFSVLDLRQTSTDSSEQDINDWGTPGPVVLAARLNGLYYAPKTREGMMVLQHEQTARSVDAFVETYGTLQSQGWRAMSIPDALGLSWCKFSFFIFE